MEHNESIFSYPHPHRGGAQIPLLNRVPGTPALPTPFQSYWCTYHASGAGMYAHVFKDGTNNFEQMELSRNFETGGLYCPIIAYDRARLEPHAVRDIGPR